MKWDCYLANSNVDCAVLESSLTSKIPFLRIVPARSEADVVVILTTVPAEDGTRFKLDLVGRLLDGYATEVHATDKIPSSIDASTALVRILTKLERGLDNFMDQEVVAEVKNGKLDIEVVDPHAQPFTGRPEQSSMKWYLAPTVGANFSRVVGVGVNASGNASVLFNYSERIWRLQQTLGANYTRLSQPVAGTTETASIHFAGGNANNVLSWSVSNDRRWSVGLLFSAEKNPQANYTLRANGSTGVEFDLVPRQTVNQMNLGFRCAVGPEAQKYDTRNTEGLRQQLIGRQFCDAFVSWHFQPIDVFASLGETSVLSDAARHTFVASFSANWRLTDNLILSPWVSVQQVNKAINEAEPTTTAYADPRQEVQASMRASVQQSYIAPFGVQSGLSIRYLFGNGSLSSEDQRWKGASNLR